MTLRLILTRHAKSAWDDPLMDDHARPLNDRGRASADAIGDWLVANGHHPDQALVSSAVRTRETWARIAAQFGDAPEASIRHDLYHADPDRMLVVLRQATGKVVMMIAHNPGSAWFARALAMQPPADSRFAQYPTAATTVFDFDIGTWSDVTWGAGEVVDFVVPRDLIEDR
jgi:phosphohistidine phosphatase